MVANWRLYTSTWFVLAAILVQAGCGGNDRGTVVPVTDGASPAVDDAGAAEEDAGAPPAADSSSAADSTPAADGDAAGGSQQPGKEEIAGPPFDLSYVSDDFFAAVSLSPSQLAKNPALFELIKTQAVGDLLKDAPFDLTTVQHALVLSAPRTEDAPEGEEVTLGVILTFQNRVDAAGTVALIQEKGEKKQVGGKTDYAQGGIGGLSAYISDD